MAYFHPTLKCFVGRVDYNFAKRVGLLFMGPGSCTDMQGAINLFVALDPNVRLIGTYQEQTDGWALDTLYSRRRGGQWRATQPTVAEAAAASLPGVLSGRSSTGPGDSALFAHMDVDAKPH